MKTIADQNGAFSHNWRIHPVNGISPSDGLDVTITLPADHYSTPNSPLLAQLIQFLQHELNIPAEAIEIARREEAHLPHLLPMVLWQYGLVSLEQLAQIFDWLDTVQSQAYEAAFPPDPSPHDLT